MAILSRILVPIDGSETSLRAANTAVDLAKRYGASITILHVISIDLYFQAIGIYRLSYPDSVKSKIDEAKKEANKWFDPIRRTADQNKVQANFEVLDSELSVVNAIVNFAEQDETDMIIIGTRGRSGFTKLLLGSVASGVVTYASCPVMVVK